MSELANRTIKNTVWNFSGFVLALLLSFISMPIIIGGIGVKNYGFFILLNTLLMIFSLLDFGIHYSFFKKLSENPEKPNYEKLNKLFSLTFWFYLAVGVFGFIVLIVCQNIFLKVANINFDILSSYTIIFFLLGLIFFVRMVGISFLPIQSAIQRWDIIAKINLISVTLIQCGGVAAILIGYGITALIVVQLIATLIITIIYIYYGYKSLPDLKIKFYFSFVEFRKIFKDGFMVFISNTMYNIIAQFDKFILSLFWGPVAVSYYASSQMITDKIQTSCSSISGILAPVFSNVSHLKENEKLINIFHRGVKTLSIFAFSLLMPVLLYGKEFLEFWLGHEFAENGTPAIYFLAFTYFLLAIFGFVYSLSFGLKLLKFLVFATGLIAVLDIIFMFILIPYFSVTGAAIAYLLSVIPVPFYLYYIERKVFNVKSRRVIIYFYLKMMAQLLITGLAVFIVGKFLLVDFVTNLLMVLLAGGVSFVMYIAFFKLFRFFEKEDWDLFLNYFKKVLRFNS